MDCKRADGSVSLRIQSLPKRVICGVYRNQTCYFTPFWLFLSVYGSPAIDLGDVGMKGLPRVLGIP